MSFGWSVGDIAQFISLSFKIYQAFNDGNKNSSRQHAVLAGQVKRFGEALELLKSTLEGLGQTRFPYYEDVKSTLEQCDKFLTGYDVLKEKKGITYHVKTVKWLTEEESIAGLHSEIRGHEQFIQLYIAHLQL